MNVHYFQHVPFEGPGIIEAYLASNGHRISVTRFFERDCVIPAPGEIDALIVLGGPMNVYDEPLFPWLHEEKAFIEDCMQQGKRVLGICLGAQLIACCLGAGVFTAKHKEIGWFPVMPVDGSEQVSWFHELFREHPVVFHWHGDKFDLPYDDSIELLRSEANDRQAFIKGDRIIALQFHLETTEDGVRDMMRHCADELKVAPFVQSGEAIESGFAHLPKAHAIMTAILDHLLR